MMIEHVDDDGVIADQVRRYRHEREGEVIELRVATWYSGQAGIVRQTISRVVVRRAESRPVANVARFRKPFRRAA